MDISNHSAFAQAVEAGGRDVAPMTPQVETELERLKAMRESDMILPGLGISVLLLAAGWFAGVFEAMLVAVALRMSTDILAQGNARITLAKIAAGQDLARSRKRANHIAMAMGVGWALVLWPVQDRILSNVGGIFVLIAVHVAGVLAALMTAPSPRSLHHWLAGFGIATAPLLLWRFDLAIVFPLIGGALFISLLLMMSARLHAQCRAAVALQFENSELAEEVSAINAALARSLSDAEKLARQDSLTGLANRRAFENDAVSLHIDRGDATRHLLLVDLDHFKQVNDCYGHASGDAVLAAVSAAIGSVLGNKEICARWGGEEFVALLLDCGIDEAVRRAEALRARISTMHYPGAAADVPAVTASIGIAAWRGDEPLEDAVARADRAMYDAKTSGRNCVRHADMTPSG